MKTCALSIVLLLTASALSGCAGDSESDDITLAGTSWMIVPDMDMSEPYHEYYCSNDGEEYAEAMGGILCPEDAGDVPTCPNGQPCVCIDVDDSCTDGDDDWGYELEDLIGQYSMEVVSIRTFGEDGSIEDFSLAGVEGCPMGTVSHTEDESLCVVDMSSLGEMSVNMEWRIDDNGHLIASSVMVMGGDNFAMEMDEMTCNMMAGMMVSQEITAHYSVEYTVNWLDDENACEIGSEIKMTLILEDGNLVYHVVHPMMEGDMVVMACAVGIKWTGQTELSESELATIQDLLSQCPAMIPSDAVVWDCELHIWLDSLPDLSKQSFNDSASEHPGYPEWCGTIVEDDLALDGSEPNLPPAEDLYGLNWGGGVWARSETRSVDSSISQLGCPDRGGTWDEELSMCSFPMEWMGCEPIEADSQLIYSECNSVIHYTAYYWSGDYLYIGNPSTMM
jgi:hypothetical protein|tara:strand:+ start:115 stop:1461 length:1347 start_codon:yes stop_codon:yes gene_type:complete